MSKDEEVIFALMTILVLLIIAAILLVVGYMIAAIIVWLIAAYRYHRYRQSARLAYQAVSDEVGASYDADSVFRAMFGAGIQLGEDGFSDPVEWMEATLFGIEEDRVGE